MEVILTLSNRITFAGAIPLVLALGILALVAVITLAPARPALATENAGTCNLSAVHLDMLLDRHNLQSQHCDTLDFDNALRTVGDKQPTADVWDYSGHGLSSFSISKDDQEILRRLNSTNTDDPIVITDVEPMPAAVKYIDLSGNPLTIDDVDFTYIPSRIALILSADSTTNGFQSDEYTVTEAAPSYVAVAFPSLKFTTGSSTLTPTFAISGSDAAKQFTGTDQPYQSGSHRQLIKFGVGSGDDNRTSEVNSLSENKIFYLPLTVDKDNDTRDDWDFRITIQSAIQNAQTGYKLANSEADITVLDADKPATSVCDRSEDVEAAILNLAAAASTQNTYGGHTRCDDLTGRDLAAITTLAVSDDDGDGEPIRSLVSGDFGGLTNLTTLTITGAGTLPSGIFADVGKDGAGVQISFVKNDNQGDDDIAEVGKYTPSTLPQHVFDDQQPKQVIILDDDLNADKKGVTAGLDATAYAVTEGSKFFALTPATQTYHVVSKSVTIEGDNASTVVTPTISDANRGTADSPKVARYAIAPPDDADSNDESMWLFLFSQADPTSAAHLVDLATVSVTDDD